MCSGFPTQILLIVIVRALGLDALTSDGGLSPPFVFTVSLLDAVIVVGLVLMFLRAHDESPRTILSATGLSFVKPFLALRPCPRCSCS